MNPLPVLVEDVLRVMPGDHKLMPDLCKLIAFDKGKPISEVMAASNTATSKIELSPELGRKLISVLESGRDCGIDWLDDLCNSEEIRKWVRKPCLLRGLEGMTGVQLATISLMNDASDWVAEETTCTGAYRRSVISEISKILRPPPPVQAPTPLEDCHPTSWEGTYSMILSYGRFELKGMLSSHPSPLHQSTVTAMQDCRDALDKFLKCAGDHATIKNCARVFKRSAPFKDYLKRLLTHDLFQQKPMSVLLLEALGMKKRVSVYKRSSYNLGVEIPVLQDAVCVLTHALATIEKMGGPEAVVDDAAGRALQGMQTYELQAVMSELRLKSMYVTRDVDACGHMLDFYKKMEAMGEDRRHRHEERMRKKRRMNDDAGPGKFAVLKFQRRGTDHRDITYEVDGKQVHLPQFCVNWDGARVEIPLLYKNRASVCIHPIHEGADAKNADAKNADAKNVAVAVTGTCTLGELAWFSKTFDAVTHTMEDISVKGANSLYSMCKAVSQCILCARELSSEKSIERGVGPVCAAAFRGMPPFSCPATASERPAIAVKDLVSRLDPDGQSVISVLSEEGGYVSEHIACKHIASSLMPGNVSGDDVSQALRDLDVMEQTRFGWTPPTGRRRVVAMLLAPHILDATRHGALETVSVLGLMYPVALCVAAKL
jgi:hypothetical protein